MQMGLTEEMRLLVSAAVEKHGLRAVDLKGWGI